ncbi:MAG: dTDP-4-dehydrorhamnose reductase [Pseudomonadota bacterium]
MKILVTGRHGQLARSLAELGGEAVTLAGRPELDLAIPGSARVAILAARPTLVINAAAFTAVDLAETEEEAAHRINVDAAEEVAAAAAELGAPVIHISTDYVFDGRASAPYAETDATNPLGVYGRTKLAGEEAVRAANPRHLILRTSWLFSPFGKNFVSTMLALGRQRDRLSVVADQHGNPTSALDLADAILLVARRWAEGDRTGLGQTYHLAGSGIASWFDLAVAVQQEAATGTPVSPITTADWPTPAARPAYSALDSGKFARDFGHVLPDWRVSLAPIIARLAAA